MSLQSTMSHTIHKSTQTDDISVKKQETVTIIVPLDYYERMSHAYYASLYNQSAQNNNNTIAHEIPKTVADATTTTIGLQASATDDKSTGHSLETTKEVLNPTLLDEVDLDTILASNTLEFSTFSPISDVNDDIIEITPPMLASSIEVIEGPSVQPTTTASLPRKYKPKPKSKSKLKSKSLGKRKSKRIMSSSTASDVESIIRNCTVPVEKVHRSQFTNPYWPLPHLGKIPKKKQVGGDEISSLTVDNLEVSVISKDKPSSQAETRSEDTSSSTAKSNDKKSLLRAYLTGDVPALPTANEDLSNSSLESKRSRKKNVALSSDDDEEDLEEQRSFVNSFFARLQPILEDDCTRESSTLEPSQINTDFKKVKKYFDKLAASKYAKK
ncbi:unnamed protein product [Rotaria magnacalcarata]|uniref:Uncharacterized protein n=1 Tax=Rotaria magnacalcarata TaxID=392030 RepID=A0A816S8A9_9BILA|nr:unnamed protein product [Rotaria magnacalcarata]CAF3803695.1 unnamed protein product [Rotaria magnacalcarata]